MKTREEIIEFVMSNDVAYVYGAGTMYAFTETQREWMANVIEGTNYVIPIDPQEEGGGSLELAGDEVTIFKCYNSNEEPLYIAVSDIEYRVEDTETGEAVLYEGGNRFDAIKEILEDIEEDLEVDLFEDGERIWCGAINTIKQLKNA